jgi:hypothetical protein
MTPQDPLGQNHSCQSREATRVVGMHESTRIALHFQPWLDCSHLDVCIFGGSRGSIADRRCRSTGIKETEWQCHDLPKRGFNTVDPCQSGSAKWRAIHHKRGSIPTTLPISLLQARHDYGPPSFACLVGDRRLQHDVKPKHATHRGQSGDAYGVIIATRDGLSLHPEHLSHSRKQQSNPHQPQIELQKSK